MFELRNPPECLTLAAVALGWARPWMSPEAEWRAILPWSLGWPLQCAVATVASACTGLTWARPEVLWIEVSPERIRRSSKLKGTCGWPGVQRSIREATGASREVPAIADDCSRHKWCSSLARRDCKVESVALSTLVLTERRSCNPVVYPLISECLRHGLKTYLPFDTFYTSAPHSIGVFVGF